MSSSKKQHNEDKNQKKRFWTPGRIGLTGAVLLLITAIASAVLWKGPEEPPADAVSASTNPSPARRRSGRTPLAELSSEVMASKFELLSGKPSHLADYAGKVVVLNLWATWCGPCRIEIPHLVELAKEFKDRGVEVIGLSTEEKAEADAAVREFITAFEINYPIGWTNQEIASVVLNNSPSIPQSIIIGKDGKLHRHLIGFNPRITPRALRAAVEEAIAK